MSSSARRVQWKAPFKLMSTTRSHSSADMRIARPSSRTPALLTSTRTGPKRSRTWSKAAPTCSGSETSACTSAPLRDSVATVKPSARRRSAIAAPMPREPPVTSAQPPSRADMLALLPAHDARAPHEAGAERGQRHDRTRLEAALALGLLEGERDRGRRRVGDTVDVDHDLLGRQAHLGRRGLDDPHVGLVGDEQVDVLDRQPGALDRLVRRGDHAPDRVAVDLAALHAEHRLDALGVEHVRLGGVGAEDEAAAAELELAAGHHDGAGAVAEQRRGAAVVVVGDARQRLGAAHERDAGTAALDLRGGLVERVDEAGARGVDVDRAGALGAEGLGHVRRHAGRQAVGRDGGDDDQVDLGGGAAGVLEGACARAGGEVGQQLALGEDAALADAGAAHDPLVGGVETSLEVGVRDDALGHGGADAEDPGLEAAAPLGRAARGGRALTLPVAGGRAGPLLCGGGRRHAAARVRLTRPVRTAPGPSSTKRSTPAARSASSVSRQRTARSRFSASSARTSPNGAAVPFEYTGIAMALTGVRSRAARTRSAAGSMSGEWKAPVTSRRRARAPVSSRATSSTASRASTGPDSTSWPGALSLATTSPWRSASARTSWDSPPSIAIIPPGRCSPASPMAAARSSTSPTASSNWSAPAATSAAYSPSEWPAAAIASPASSPSASVRQVSQAATEHRNSAGCW